MTKRQPRLGVTITEEMYRALEEESRKNFNAPVSALVRQAIEDWLRARGHDVRADITWGGSRHPSDEESGQFAAVATVSA
jgi:hypothetical protein